MAIVLANSVSNVLFRQANPTTDPDLLKGVLLGVDLNEVFFYVKSLHFNS